MRRGVRPQIEAVHQGQIWCGSDTPHRACHGADIGAMQAMGVDGARGSRDDDHLLGIHHHRPNHRSTSARAEPLRVIQPRQGLHGCPRHRPEVEAHRRGHKGPCQTPAPGLVGTNHTIDPQLQVVVEQRGQSRGERSHTSTLPPVRRMSGPRNIEGPHNGGPSEKRMRHTPRADHSSPVVSSTSAMTSTTSTASGSTGVDAVWVVCQFCSSRTRAFLPTRSRR